MAEVDGVGVKIARSIEHIVSLQTETAEFIRDNPVRYRSEHDDGPPKGWAFYAEWVQVPGRLGAIIGDALTNMRAALDHLAWRAFNATSPARTARIHFPICSAEPAPGELAKMLGRFPPAVRPIVEAVQPYQNVARNRSAEIHPLYVLNLLVNTDKHRALTLTEMFGADSSIRVTGLGGSPCLATVEAPGGLVTEMIGWLPDQAFPSDEPWEIQATINPVLAIDAGHRRMYPIADLLMSMHSYVRDEVIAPIRIGCF